MYIFTRIIFLISKIKYLKIETRNILLNTFYSLTRLFDSNMFVPNIRNNMTG